MRCLAVLEDQATSADLKTAIRQIQLSVEGGDTLTRSFSPIRRFQQPVYRSGPRWRGRRCAGRDVRAFVHLPEEDLKLKRKVKAAMTYPIIVVCISLCIVIGLVTFIVPKFISLFQDFDLKLPAITMLLVSVSHFMTTWTNDIIVVGTLVVSSSPSTDLRRRKRGNSIRQGDDETTGGRAAES